MIKKTILNLQYRMEKDMGELVSQTFYEGKLQSHKKGIGNLFFHHVTGRLGYIDSSSFCKKEAILALRYAIAIQRRHKESEVVILSYYYGQIMEIRKQMASSQYSFQVCTVDSYQGMEADYVVLSTCSQQRKLNPFVADKKRACVAVSRGKCRLIILGNPQRLLGNTLWRGMLSKMRSIIGDFVLIDAVQ